MSLCFYMGAHAIVFHLIHNCPMLIVITEAPNRVCSRHISFWWASAFAKDIKQWAFRILIVFKRKKNVKQFLSFTFIDYLEYHLCVHVCYLLLQACSIKMRVTYELLSNKGALNETILQLCEKVSESSHIVRDSHAWLVKQLLKRGDTSILKHFAETSAEQLWVFSLDGWVPRDFSKRPAGELTWNIEMND